MLRVQVETAYLLVGQAWARVLQEYEGFKDQNTVVERGALENLEAQISEMAGTLQKVAEQVPIQDLARQALELAGDVNETVLTKGWELNRDYDVLRRIMDGVKDLINNVRG
jgi:hypothetical protein